MREVQSTTIRADGNEIVVELETLGWAGRRRDRVVLHPALARRLSDDLLLAVAEHERARREEEKGA